VSLTAPRLFSLACAVSIEGACVDLVWAFATKWDLANPVHEFTAPPLRI
jgi:hypothetical protein